MVPHVHADNDLDAARGGRQVSRNFSAYDIAVWARGIAANLPEEVTHWYVSFGADEFDEDDRLDVWRLGRDYWCVRWQPDCTDELPDAEDVCDSTAEQVLYELDEMSNEPGTAWQVWFWHVLNHLDRDLVQLLNDVAAERDAAREADK